MNVANEWLKITLVLFVLVISMFYFIERADTILHESVHVAEFNYFGYNAKYVLTDFGLAGRTFTNDTVSTENAEKMHLVHQFNEIVSYNLASVRYTIYLLVIMQVFIISNQVIMNKILMRGGIR